MADDLIRYDVLTQDALRGVVKRVLSEVAKTGLPGEHHFFISFATRHPGVRVSSRIRQQYPEEMTIVLQHQFWDLSVTDGAFEVGLSFNGVPERLLVPFRAVTAFVDPAASFGLKFSAPEAAPAEEAPSQTAAPQTAAPKSPPPALPRAVEPPPRPAKPAVPAPAAAESGDDAAKGADVVSLEAFRKKNT